jgi:hypothetical protein
MRICFLAAIIPRVNFLASALFLRAVYSCESGFAPENDVLEDFLQGTFATKSFLILCPGDESKCEFF